jgi:ammonium transporter Rh
MVQDKVSRKTGVILLFLVVVAAMAIAFFPSVNHNVAEGMQALSNAEQLSQEAKTIYDSITYGKSIHILAMLMVGFGFLMVFVRKHEYSSLTATFLAVSIAVPLYMLIKSFGGEEFSKHVISMDGFLFAEFAAASLLIAMGAVLGRLKMDQYFLLGLLFVPAYIFNEWLLLESGFFPGFLDTGGSVAIHAFGAYFGLGLIAFTDRKFKNAPLCESNKTSNEFCLLGSMILWLFWPSFTSSVVSPELGILTAINTVFALSGSTLTTYLFSKLIRGKVEIEDIANAALAGGVAIGSACSSVDPGFAMVIGMVAGLVSTVGYTILAPKVCKLIGGTDTCGVHNLHGMPGILGGLSAMAVTGKPSIQILAIVCTVLVALVLGRVAGLVLGLLGTKEIPYSDEDEFFVH